MEFITVDLDKPQNLRERRAFYRHFYNSVPEVGEFIDKNSFVNKCGLNELTLGAPLEQLHYINNFFKGMFKRLNLDLLVSQIKHEYLMMGNCFTFTVDTVVTKKGKALKYDLAPLYPGWNKILILPPDQVRVRKIPLEDLILLEYMPDPETLRSLKKNRKFSRLLKNGNIPLDQDPTKGSFAHLFSRKASQYETLGISPLEKHVKDLTENKRIVMVLTEGERDLINTSITTFIEDCILKPVAIKKGFISSFSDKSILYPSFYCI